MNLVQDLARQIKASLPFAVLNEDPRNMFEKLVTYKSLSDIPSNIHIFNTTGNSTSDFIVKRESAPGGIGFSHPTLEIRAGKDVGEYNTLAFNTYAGGPLAKISTEVVAAGVYPNSIAKLHFAIQNGAGQQTMLTISENSTSEFAGSVGIGKSPGFALDVDGDINISAGNTLKIDGVDAVFSNWSTNGATIYRNSNVGIGDFSGSAPTEALDIDGSINLSAGNTLKIDGVAAVFSNWTVNGSDIYRLSDVGIGTDAPAGIGSRSLNVKASTSAGADLTVEADNGTNFGVFYSGPTASDPFSIFSNTGFKFATASDKNATGYDEHLRILPSGKVGIGTSSVDTLLHVEAADGVAGGAIKYTATGVASGYLSASPDGTVLATDTANITFRTGITPNDPTDTGTERLRITSAGLVGINDTSPDFALDCNVPNGNLSSIAACFTTNSSEAVISFQGTETTDNGSARFGIHSDDNFYMQQNDASTFFFGENAKFGIGTDEPAYRIHSVGTAGTNSSLVLEETTSGVSRKARLQQNSGATILAADGTSNSLVFETADEEHARITSTGNVGIGTDVPTGLLNLMADGATPYTGVAGILLDLKRGVSNGAATNITGIRLANNSNGFRIEYGGTTDHLQFIDGGGSAIATFGHTGNAPGINFYTNALKIDSNETWNYNTVRTKNYSTSNLTMSAGGKAWVKLFSTAQRGNIAINFYAGSGNSQEYCTIDLNLTYYAVYSKITVHKSTYSVMVEAVRLIQQSDGGNHEVWVKLNVDSNQLVNQTYFGWNIASNWSAYDGLSINNTTQYTEPSLPSNGGWHKTLELNRTSHDLDRVATATSGGGIFKAGMEFPLMTGKSLIMEVQPDVYWSLAWWEASDGSWWLLGRQGRHPDFVRADAEFYIPTGNILDVPAS